MAVIRLISEQDFRTSRYAQVEDQIDGNLSDLIAQAEAYIEGAVERRIDAVSYTEIIRPTGGILFLANRPIVSITSVKRRLTHDDAWETLDNADFEIMMKLTTGDTGTIRDLDEQCAGYETQVVYTAGYSTIPADVKAAVILQTVVFAYQNLAIYSGGGDGKPDADHDLQKDVDALIKRFKKVKL